jgi:FMN-dependent NADH-azoreductase
MNILHVIASPRAPEESISKQMAFRFFGTLMEKNPDVNINNFDLYQNKPPFVSNDFLNGAWKAAADPSYEPTRNEETATNFARNNVQALAAADVLVISTPVWLNTMPAILAAWIDQILFPGVIFDISGGTVVPKHNLRSVVLLVSSEGIYKEDDPSDGLTPALRAAFRYIGVDDIRIAWADGQTPSCADQADRLELAMDAAAEIAEDLLETP